ncbi:hypothetical protein BH18ACT14_BH18ACT14_06600 [soil metagenome]
MAKMQREQRVKERRAAKQEKKQAAAAAKIAEANGETLPTEDAVEEPAEG